MTNHTWPAMALIACLLGGSALADPTGANMRALGYPPYPPCLETASQIEAALARLYAFPQKDKDKHPEVMAAAERITVDKSRLLQQCQNGDVDAAQMLVQVRAATEFLVSVVDPDPTKHPSGAIVGGGVVKETHEQRAR